MMIRGLISLAILSCLVQGISSAAKETGNIRVSLTDPFGSELEHYTLELQSLAGRVIAGGPDRKEFTDVPYDEYRLIARNRCCIGERRLILNVRDLWVRFGVPIRYGDAERPGGYLVIRGSLRGHLDSTQWIRVTGLFLDFNREAKVGKNGKFSIGGLDMGAYLIEIFSSKRMIASRAIEIDIKREVTEVPIDVPSTR